MRRFLAVLVVALAAAPATIAHGPEGGGAGYVSTFAALEPQILGVSVTVLGGDDRLQLTTYSGKTIEVFGYEHEPFLRFGETGIYENTRSPSTYVSRVRDPEDAQIPPSADTQAQPRWRKVSSGNSFAWHDRRIHWMGEEPPAVVQRAPEEEHRIFAWRVPARADGDAFLIEGFLGYRPVVAASDESGLETWELVLAVVLGAVAVLAAAAGARRLRRRAP